MANGWAGQRPSFIGISESCLSPWEKPSKHGENVRLCSITNGKVMGPDNVSMLRSQLH